MHWPLRGRGPGDLCRSLRGDLLGRPLLRLHERSVRPDGAVLHAVRLLGSVFHGFSSLETAGGFSHSAPDSEETWTRILDALDALLRNWPAQPTP